MADTKISGLSAATAVLDTDIIPIVSGGVNYRATRAALLTGTATVLSNSASSTVLIAKGALSQSGDLIQGNNNSGVTLFKVDSVGNVTVTSATVSTEPRINSINNAAKSVSLWMAPTSGFHSGRALLYSPALDFFADGSSGDAGDISFYTNDLTGFVDIPKVTITNTGQVLICNSSASPSGMLHVISSANNIRSSIFQGIIGQTANISEWRDNTGAARTYIGPSGNAFVNPGSTAATPLVVKVSETKAPTVNNKELTSNVATLTTSTSHGFYVGETVVVTGVDSTFNGTYTITSIPSTTTFTYAKTAANVPSQSATGTATASQTANLFEGRDTSNNLVGAFGPSGSLYFAGGGGTPRKFDAVDGANVRWFRFSGSNNTNYQLALLRDWAPALSLPSGYQFAWTSSSTTADSQPDTGLARSSAAVVKATNSGAGLGAFICGQPTTGTVGLTVQAIASATANLQEWQNSSGTALTTIGSDGTISSPGAGTNSEHFGLGSTAAGANATAFGKNSTAGSSNGVAVGYNASSFSGVAIGSSAAYSAGNYGIAIGESSSVTGNYSIGIGKSVSVSAGGIGLGAGATAGSGQFVVGSSTQAITSMTFAGAAATIQAGAPASGAGNSLTLRGSDAVGGNNNGGDVALTPGAKAGSGADGNVTVARGCLVVPDGAYYAPSIQFSGGASTGFYRLGVGQVSFVHNTSGALTFLTSGIQVTSVNSYQFSSAGSIGSASDTALTRSSAAVVKLTNASTGLGALVCGQPTTGTVGLVVQAVASATANLQEWQNSSGVAVASVDKSGNITAPNLTTGALSGTYASLPAAGIAGRRYIATDSILEFVDNGSVWQGFISGHEKFTIPDFSSGWAWDNQGATTITDKKGWSLIEKVSAGATAYSAYYKTAPSTPWTLTVCMPHISSQIPYSAIGIGFRESSSGKLHVVMWDFDSTNGIFESSKFTNTSTFSAAYVQWKYSNLGHIPSWFRIKDDGSNRLVYYSVNGTTWSLFSSVGRTDFLTADQYCIFIGNPGTSGYSISGNIFSLAVT